MLRKQNTEVAAVCSSAYLGKLNKNARITMLLTNQSSIRLENTIYYGGSVALLTAYKDFTLLKLLALPLGASEQKDVVYSTTDWTGAALLKIPTK